MRVEVFEAPQGKTANLSVKEMISRNAARLLVCLGDGYVVQSWVYGRYSVPEQVTIKNCQSKKTHTFFLEIDDFDSKEKIDTVFVPFIINTLR